ncbi:NDR1/HIN1-like protein 1 [Henckelia pumila]|uniref:NDR1/HIN1-like protein 1 n=1 Tax=Henckelia pumila TaxID=405737 RepID=UPI003C6E74C9
MGEEKVCSHHKNKRKRFLRRCCATVLVINFILLLTILIVWAVLQPKKPRFILQDATIFSLNVSAPNIISTTVQATVFSRNPNSRIGIYYDRMYIYATYNSQQITYFTTIPPVYQGHKDVNVWSPFIYGTNVPVAPYNGPSLSMDLNNGDVTMLIKLDGRVKWKVGTFTTGRYHLHVTCRANIPIGNTSKNNGIIIGAAVKYQIQQSCSVSV